jgi:hypothetical protein
VLALPPGASPHESGFLMRHLLLLVLLFRRRRDFWINLDPMISYLGAYFAAIPVKNDEVRLLLWHVAINAITGDWARHFRVALAFMAAQAMFGKCDRVLLGQVNVVASQASHG